MNNIKMLYFYVIDVSEGIDVNKISKSKECDIYHYWYLLKTWFKFKPYVCNRCHDLLMMSMNLSHIAISKIKNANYRCIIIRFTKSEAIKLLQNIDFIKFYKIIAKYWFDWKKFNIIKLNIKSNFEAVNLLQILMKFSMKKVWWRNL